MAEGKPATGRLPTVGTRKARRCSVVLLNDDDTEIIKEGWLLKRGEFIRNWRKRYYRLMSDGMFYGFKTKPDPEDVEVVPENHFRCADSIKITDETKTKKNAFAATVMSISFQAKTVVVKRIFCADSPEERESWKSAMLEVAHTIKNGNRPLEEEKESEKLILSMDDFTLMKTLGRGAFGKVVLARYHKTDEIFALKILKKSVIIEKNEVEHLAAENNVLQKTDHPFLASLKYSFQTADRLCFVMEYIQGGEIFFHLSRERRFSVERTRFYGAEMLDALDYLHTLGIVYRDLKLENVMLAKDGHVKITDFGLCKEQINYGDATKTFCGTPEYLAPEVLEEDVYHRSVDFWALGIAMFEMAAGYLPYVSNSQDTLFAKIVYEPIKYPKNMYPPLRSLLVSLLQKDPELRLGHGPEDAAEIKAHPFFSDIDFDKLRRKEIPPPFIPTPDTPEETTKNFDEMFTSKPARLTVEVTSDMLEEVTLPKFDGFTYTGEPTILGA